MTTRFRFLMAMVDNPELACFALAASVNVVAQGVVVYRYSSAVKQVRLEHAEKVAKHPGLDFSSNLKYNLLKAKDNAYTESVVATIGSLFSPALSIAFVLGLPLWIPTGLVYSGIRFGGPATAP